MEKKVEANEKKKKAAARPAAKKTGKPQKEGVKIGDIKVPDGIIPDLEEPVSIADGIGSIKEIDRISETVAKSKEDLNAAIEEIRESGGSEEESREKLKEAVDAERKKMESLKAEIEKISNNYHTTIWNGIDYGI